MQRSLPPVIAVAFFAILALPNLHGQNWRPVGPAGGDVRTLAADPANPSVIYLGTSDGHVFGSRDAGEHWQLLGRVGDRHDTIVMAIAVDARNSSTLYSAAWSLGPGGGGVFRSTDAGRTWRVAGLAGEEVRAIALAHGHPEILIAGALSGVYRSKDSGGHWERISPTNHDDLRNFDSVAIDPTNPDIIYAGTYHLAWKTSDGGRNWTPIHAGMVDDSDVMSISLDYTDPQKLFASACSGIYRGESGGTHWTKYRGIPPTARRTHVLRQDPQHPATLYAATTEGLWKSVDAGATWMRMTSPKWSIATLLIHPKNSERVMIGLEGQGIYISDDGAKTFRAANDGFNHRQVMDLAYDREHPGRMLVVLTNAADPIVATNDGGLTWTALGPGLKAHMLRHVYAAPDGWWAALQDGGLMRYVDRKAQWIKIGTVPVSAPAPTKRSVKTAAAKTAAVKTARPFTAVVNDLAFTRSLWLAATQEGLMVSADRGAVWSPFPSALLSRQPVDAVRVSADGSRLWLASARGVTESRDAGKSWKTANLSVDARSRLHLHQLEPDTLLLSSSSAVYASDDAGETWRAVNLPEPAVQDLAVAGSALLLSTPKHGLQVSYDRGRSWQHVAAPVSEGTFPLLAAGGATSAVLAGSATEGLYSLEIPRGGSSSASEGRGNSRPANRPQP